MVVEPLYDGAVQAKTENGLRVLIDEVPQSRSVAVGVWVRVGSRDDPADRPGMAHFIEHVAFKGTNRRDASAISREIDAVGGHLNAATGKESTFYYAEVPADGLGTALDLLADLVQHPRFAPADVELERNVVLEEIRGHEDDPEESAYDLFAAGLWEDGHALSRPVLGTSDSIDGVSVDELVAHHDRMYRPDNMIVVASGAVDTDALVDLTERLFAPGVANGSSPLRRSPPAFRPGVFDHDRATGQTHLYFGFRGPDAHSDDRYALEVANSILGDGTSSRLFRTIREDRGLAYVVSSHLTAYSDAGMWLTYAGVAPRTTAEVIHLTTREFERLRSEPIPEDEFRLAKQKLRGHLILGLETNGHRAARLGAAAIQDREILSPDELFARLDRITLDDVRRVVDEYLRPEAMNRTGVGPRA